MKSSHRGIWFSLFSVKDKNPFCVMDDLILKVDVKGKKPKQEEWWIGGESQKN